jgi:hypothetical protein
MHRPGIGPLEGRADTFVAIARRAETRDGTVDDP